MNRPCNYIKSPRVLEGQGCLREKEDKEGQTSGHSALGLQGFRVWGSEGSCFGFSDIVFGFARVEGLWLKF